MNWCNLTSERVDLLRRTGILLAVISFFATIGLSFGLLFREKGKTLAPTEPVRQKSFSRVVAEGVRYRDYQSLGVDRFSFKSCRVEKRRKGAITFGAFNMLVVDCLVLNLPAEPSAFGSGEETGDKSLDGRKDEGLAGMLLSAQGLGVGRVSGVQINGLTVNRCSTNGVSFFFSAIKAESGAGKGGLRLRECVVHTPEGNEVLVKEARLFFEPEPKLVYLKNGIERSIGL
jgi:hypothetical protein